MEYRVAGAATNAGTYSVPVGSVIVATDFTGIANNAAWPAPWTKLWGQGSGSRSYVSNAKGVLVAQGLGDWSAKQIATANLNLADVDVSYTLTFGSGEMTTHQCLLRMPAANTQPSDGYMLFIDYRGIQLHRVVGWAGTAALGSNTTVKPVAGGSYKVRFAAELSLIHI